MPPHPRTWDRDKLQTLLGLLLDAQFKEVLAGFPEAGPYLPSAHSPQVERVLALLAWAAGPAGPGLGDVAERIIKVVPRLRAEELATSPANDDATTLLFLAANPQTSSLLALDKEYRAIDQRLRSASGRDAFALVGEWALPTRDLQDSLLRHRPRLVHFSGHGSKDGELVLEGEPGASEPGLVKATTLEHVFQLFKRYVRGVVLNACYSEVQAQMIVQHVDFVIGMRDRIPDDAAIEFASAFYLGLAEGEDVAFSFELALNQIRLAPLPDADVIPKLLVRPGVDPTTIRFFACRAR